MRSAEPNLGAVLNPSRQIDFTRHVADTVHFLHKGQVVEAGPPRELFDSPKTPELGKFVEYMARKG